MGKIPGGCGTPPPRGERAHPPVCKPEALKTLGSGGQGLLPDLGQQVAELVDLFGGEEAVRALGR